MYVIAWKDNTPVSVYAVGQIISQYGSLVKHKRQVSPLLCVVDDEGLLVADYDRHNIHGQERRVHCAERGGTPLGCSYCGQ